MTVEKVIFESVKNIHALKQYRYKDCAYKLLLATQN